MPYIDQKKRDYYDRVLDKFLYIIDKGDLEYCIFKLMKLYMTDKKYRYSILHDCVYAAQHCSDEFRRRYLDKREDTALETNGDVEV